jgi:hypothetical protein
MGIHMGNLKPGATLIYERANGVITAREFGSAEKHVIGYNVSGSPEQAHLSEWNEILRAAESNPALQAALDRVKIIYNLSKQNGQ